MPKVSVLIPVYNGGKYIAQAIQSALNQNFFDYEIVVSDNASTDNTEEIVKYFNDPRIRYYKNDRNIGYTRNVYRLIHELSEGEYCIILCADDYWEGEILKQGFDLFEKHENLSFVFSNLIIKDEFAQRNIYLNYQFPEVISGKDFFKLHLLKRIKSAAPSSVIFNKQAAIQVNAFGDSSLKYASDWELRLKLSLIGDIGFVREHLTIYRWHRENLTTSAKVLDKFADDIRCINNVMQFAPSLNLKDFLYLKKDGS